MSNSGDSNSGSRINPMQQQQQQALRAMQGGNNSYTYGMHPLAGITTGGSGSGAGGYNSPTSIIGGRMLNPFMMQQQQQQRLQQQWLQQQWLQLQVLLAAAMYGDEGDDEDEDGYYY